MKLFELRSAEIEEGLLEIKSAARQACAPRSPCTPTTAHRSDRHLRRMRGSRAGGDRNWRANAWTSCSVRGPATFVIALAPAEVG
jgi:hypothetical protein